LLGLRVKEKGLITSKKLGKIWKRKPEAKDQEIRTIKRERGANPLAGEKSPSNGTNKSPRVQE